MLEEFGFVCEDFGDGTVLVRQVPSDLEVGDVPAALEELAEELRLNRADPAAARDSLLQTMACKSAIKAGMWSCLLYTSHGGEREPGRHHHRPQHGG